MARQYAQIFTEIWRNADFTALDRDEQWMFLLLNTQPDITAAGTLTIAATRWAKRAPNTPVTLIRQLIDRLAAKRFLVVDWDTDEVLIRTFIKHDRGFSNPKRQPAIRDAINLVESPAILDAIAKVLRHVSMPVTFWGAAAAYAQVDRLSDSDTDSVSMAIPDAHAVQASTDVTATTAVMRPEITSSQVNRLSDSDAHTDGRSERRVPQPPNHNPETKNLKSTPLVNAARRPEEDQALIPVDGMDMIHIGSVDRAKRERQFDEFWAAYPRKVGKQGARKTWGTKVRGTRTNPGADPQAITAGAVAFGEYTRTVATPIDKIPHPQTWLNRGSWEDDLSPGADLVPVGAIPQGSHLPDGRAMHRKTAAHMDHLSRYEEVPDA